MLVDGPVGFLTLVLLIIIGVAQILMPFYVIAINAKLKLIVAALAQGQRATRSENGGHLAPAVEPSLAPNISLQGIARRDTSSRERMGHALSARYGVPRNYVSSYMDDWLGLVSQESAAQMAEQDGQIVLLEDDRGRLHCFKPRDAILALKQRGQVPSIDNINR
jgi:hypothetical protein